MIEVKHDAVKLAYRKYFKTHNANACEALFHKYCDSGKRARGFTLRFVPDPERNTIELSHRQELNVKMFERVLRAARLIVKELPPQWDAFKKLY